MSAAALPPPPWPGADERWALFVDVDGTLLDFAPRPDLVHLPSATRGLLARLHAALDGALAVLSGRDLPDLDHLLAPLQLPVGAMHGLTRRDADGIVVAPAVPAEVAAAVEQDCATVARELPGVRLENKSHRAFALHYRGAETQADAVHARAAAIAERFATHYLLQPGSCVAELKPAGGDKGDALVAFGLTKRFSGRRPVAIGDDLTDEAAFAAAARGGGFGIIVGPRRPTEARYALATPAALHAWLDDLLRRLPGGAR